MRAKGHEKRNSESANVHVFDLSITRIIRAREVRSRVIEVLLYYYMYMFLQLKVSSFKKNPRPTPMNEIIHLFLHYIGTSCVKTTWIRIRRQVGLTHRLAWIKLFCDEVFFRKK